MDGGFGRRAKVTGGGVNGGSATKIEVAANTSATQAECDNRRFAPRRKSQTPGHIFTDSGASIPCMIADMSTTGARLLMQEGWSNPFRAQEAATLTLVIRHDKVMYECRIVRRGENELGVRYLTAPRPYVPKKPAPAPAKLVKQK